MKVVGQTLKDGAVRILDAPPPVLPPGFVRVRTLYSAISPGTEGGKVVAGRMSLFGKAKAKPEQVRQVLDMAKQIGIRPTFQKVRDKLEGAQPLGYSSAGEIIEVGDGVDGYAIGDLVACAGGGYAVHADEVVVPVNLIARIPAGVAPDAAAMTTLACIALQGIRLTEPTIGEHAVVIGLGIIGLSSCQLLQANGCRVFAADIDPTAVARAHAVGVVDRAGVIGADPIESQVSEFTRGHGADLVLICAATASDDPVQLAGRIARKRGRIVVVGAVGMNLPRTNYYEKELRFGVSCSYGPGRYDPHYEEGGSDYPLGFVRWTEGRNMVAVLDLMAGGRFDPLRFVTHRIPFATAPQAYDMIAGKTEPFCGVLVEYPDKPTTTAGHRLARAGTATPGKIGISFVGAGSFAQSFLLPPFKASRNAVMRTIFTRTGLTAADIGARYGFAKAVDSVEAAVSDSDTAAVVIATRHDQHGPVTAHALRAGRHVFVEKPLCLNEAELDEIRAGIACAAALNRQPILQVGFNRRFSAAARLVKKHFGTSPGPMTMMYRINAGHIGRDHWTQDPAVGGGRIIGEVCHFIDLMQYVCGGEPESVFAMKIDSENSDVTPADNVVISLRFSGGSVGTIGYFAEGAKSLPKERFEAFTAGRSAILDNFQSVTLFSGSRKRKVRCPGKGIAEEVAAFMEAVASGIPAIPLDSQIATTRATFAAMASLRDGQVHAL